MKYRKTLFVILLIFLVVLTACTQSAERTIKPLDKSIFTEKKGWEPTNTTKVEKLVFSLPSMDRKMCETFPQLIIENLEAEKGVIDASFVYEGHIVTIIYDPEVISKEDLLAYETYNWIGVENASSVTYTKDPKEIFAKRLENNNFVMPKDHMTSN